MRTWLWIMQIWWAGLIRLTLNSGEYKPQAGAMMPVFLRLTLRLQKWKLTLESLTTKLEFWRRSFASMNKTTTTSVMIWTTSKIRLTSWREFLPRNIRSSKTKWKTTSNWSIRTRRPWQKSGIKWTCSKQKTKRPMNSMATFVNIHLCRASWQGYCSCQQRPTCCQRRNPWTWKC